ncbi:MAG: hypothetical protein AABW99_04335 [archaeon]
METKILDAALFRLAFERRITLEQARIAKHVHENGIRSAQQISKELKLGREETAESLIALTRQGLLKSQYDLFYTQNLAEKIAELISREETPKKEKLALIER